MHIILEIYRLLDKAATVTQDDMYGPKNPWRLCTVTQVEEAKCILKLIPIWLCTIIYSVIFTQMVSVFVEQGDVMHRTIGNFHIPAASMSAFDICSVLIFTGVYEKIIVPVGEKITGKPRGMTELQRMGVGLIIGILAMVAAGITEMERLKRVIPGEKDSSLSIFWQIPQYLLVGASEVFMYIGQLEFFNGEAPDGVKSALEVHFVWLQCRLGIMLVACWSPLSWQSLQEEAALDGSLITSTKGTWIDFTFS